MSKTIVSQGKDWTIVKSDEGRTAAPFLAEPWGDGRVNHPYVELFQQPDLVDTIPEVQIFPALGRILSALNCHESLLRSTQCDTGLLKCNPDKTGGYSIGAGAIIHVAFREADRNLDLDKLFTLANMIQTKIVRPEFLPFRIRLTIEPYKNWYDTENSGHHGLALEFICYGYDDSSAWAAASAGSDAITSAVVNINSSDELQKIFEA